MFHPIPRTIPTEKGNLITDLKTGGCVDAMAHAQIKCPLEKQTTVLTKAVTYFTGVISQDC